MVTGYIPDEGDIIWLNFTPQRGHEQAGRRPAVVLSPKIYNHRAGLLVCVPITNQIKGYPFEVMLKGSEASGVALADQVNSLDWKSRETARKGAVSAEALAEIRAKIKTLLRLV